MKNRNIKNILYNSSLIKSVITSVLINAIVISSLQAIGGQIRMNELSKHVLPVGSETCGVPPPEQWNRIFRLSSWSNFGQDVHQTFDGGYIIVGATGGTPDCWLIKTDENGNEQWNKTFGGPYPDYGRSVQQTDDGGYIIVGETQSYGAGGTDVWLIKTDDHGNLQWSKTFGSTWEDGGYSVQQTNDGGYIITGYTAGYYSDVWLIKTYANGTLQWDRTFDRNTDEVGRSVQQTSDGGFIITGYCGFNPAFDVWLIKTDSNGYKQWDRTFGQTNSANQGYCGQQTNDRGYILVGSLSYSQNWDAWLIKTDENGYQIWNHTFGGSQGDYGYQVQQTLDGGYVIGGYTNSYGTAGSQDVWLIKTDENGIEQWNETFGKMGTDRGYSVQQTTDGGYIITGDTMSFGNDALWLIKVASENPPQSPETPIHSEPIHVHDHPNDMNKGIGKIQQNQPGGILQQFITTSSNLGTEIYYKFYFGGNTDSGWLGPYTGGEVAITTHDYNAIGVFNVSATCKIGLGGTESIPSGTRTVMMYLNGDTSDNDIIGFGDINPFVLMLSAGKDVYYNEFPDGYWYTGDINQDGAVNFGDINPFVALLSS